MYRAYHALYETRRAYWVIRYVDHNIQILVRRLIRIFSDRTNKNNCRIVVTGSKYATDRNRMAYKWGQTR